MKEKRLINKLKQYTEADYYEGVCIEHKAFDKKDVKIAVLFLKEELMDLDYKDVNKNTLFCIIDDVFSDVFHRKLRISKRNPDYNPR